MNIRTPLVASAILIALMLGLSLWAWTKLPPDALIPIHWGIEGKPDGFAHKGFALFALPALACALTLVLAFIPRIEPRRFNLAASASFYAAAWIGALVFIAVAHAAAIASALGQPIDVEAVLIAAAAILTGAIGNSLSKSRANFFAGVRTPWTLSSDYSWERTHRLTSRLFVAVAAATLAAEIILGARIAAYVFLPLPAVSIIASVVMSYIYWRRDPSRRASDMTPE